MDLELAIIQYLDGSLSETERSALEKRFEGDDAARAMLEEHRRVDAAMRAWPVPSVRWDALAERISSAVAQVEMPARQEPAASFRMPWLRVAAPMAVAASILIAIAGVWLLRRGGTTPTVATNGSSGASAVVLVTGPSAEPAAGPADVQIVVGPAPVAVGEAQLSRYSDDIVSRPARITVASGIDPFQDLTSSSDMQ